MQGLHLPDYYPDNCPPEDAEPVDGIYYRVVKECPPTKLDFVPNKLKDPLRLWQSAKDKCCACGISLFSDAAQAQKKMKRFPQIGNKIASAELKPDHGLVKKTGRASHHTLWPQATPPHSLFTCVES